MTSHQRGTFSGLTGLPSHISLLDCKTGWITGTNAGRAHAGSETGQKEISDVLWFLEPDCAWRTLRYLRGWHKLTRISTSDGLPLPLHVSLTSRMHPLHLISYSPVASVASEESAGSLWSDEASGCMVQICLDKSQRTWICKLEQCPLDRLLFKRAKVYSLQDAHIPTDWKNYCKAYAEFDVTKFWTSSRWCCLASLALEHEKNPRVKV